jgi:hypothetical protein
MKTYEGVEIQFHAFLASARRYVVSFMILGKSRRYPLDKRLGGPQGHSGNSGEGKNLYPCRKSNPNSPVVQPTD